MEQKRRAGRAPVVILMSALVSACGGGDGMCGRDGATRSEDAGSCEAPSADAGVDAGFDAGPPPPPNPIVDEVVCEPREEVTHDDDTTGLFVETRRTNWYAELRDDRITTASLRAVSALGCNVETFGMQPAPRCVPCDTATCGLGGEITCTGEPEAAPLTCRALPIEADEGVVRVFCGSRVERREETAPNSETFGPWEDQNPWNGNARPREYWEVTVGQRFRTVRFTVGLEELEP
jgi:hypothetical protein